jgi:polyisoprenyl-phosphate glycosyltransferase
VTMDSDLQHPPQVIKEFWSKRKDFPVIVARQVRRESSLGRKILAKVFYPFVQLVSGVPINRDVGDFRLIRRDIMVAISQSNLYWKPIRFLLPKHKVSTLVLDYDARERANGKSKHNSSSLLRFAFNSMLYSTNRPILLSVGFSVFFSLLSIVHISLVLYWYISGITIPGWTTITFVLSSGFAGLSLSIAVLGVYILKIIESVGFGDQNFGINMETLVGKSMKE